MIIYPDKSFYVINGFSYRNDLGWAGSAFNFSVGLDVDFALKAYNKELSDESFERLNSIGKQIIKDLGEDSKYIKNPYGFVGNKENKLTTLLRWCCVPGDACELGIEGSDLDSLRDNRFHSKMLGYGPHNIDNMTQAYSLLSIWLTWADSAFALTRKE